MHYIPINVSLSDFFQITSMRCSSRPRKAVCDPAQFTEAGKGFTTREAQTTRSYAHARRPVPAAGEPRGLWADAGPRPSPLPGRHHHLPQRSDQPRSPPRCALPAPRRLGLAGHGPKGEQGREGAGLTCRAARSAQLSAEAAIFSVRSGGAAHAPGAAAGWGRGEGVAMAGLAAGGRPAGQIFALRVRPFAVKLYFQCLCGWKRRKKEKKKRITQTALESCAVCAGADVSLAGTSVIRGSWRLPQKPQDPTLGGGPKGSQVREGSL